MAAVQAEFDPFRKIGIKELFFIITPQTNKTLTPT